MVQFMYDFSGTHYFIRYLFRCLSEANMQETKKATAKTSELLLKNSTENISAEIVQTNPRLV